MTANEICACMSHLQITWLWQPMRLVHACHTSISHADHMTTANEICACMSHLHLTCRSHDYDANEICACMSHLHITCRSHDNSQWDLCMHVTPPSHMQITWLWRQWDLCMHVTPPYHMQITWLQLCSLLARTAVGWHTTYQSCMHISISLCKLLRLSINLQLFSDRTPP